MHVYNFALTDQAINNNEFDGSTEKLLPIMNIEEGKH